MQLAYDENLCEAAMENMLLREQRSDPKRK